MASQLRYFYFLKAFLSVLFLKSHMVLASDITTPFKDLTFAPLNILGIAGESNTFLKNQSKDKKTPADKERNKENEKAPTDTINTINTIIKDISTPSFYITDLREQKNKIKNPEINIKNISFAGENLVGGFVKPSPQASSSASNASSSSTRSLPLSASSPSHAKAHQALREELRNYSRQLFTYEERQEFKRRFGISYSDALGQRHNFVYSHPHYPHK